MPCNGGDASARPFWGKGITLRGKGQYRNKFGFSGPNALSDWAKASGFDTVYFNWYVGHRRGDLDYAAGIGLKVGWWIGRSQVSPDLYQEAFSHYHNLLHSGEVLQINWELGGLWGRAGEEARQGLYAGMRGLTADNPVSIGVLARWRFENEAVAALVPSGIVWMPELYSLSAGHREGSIDTIGDPVFDARNAEIRAEKIARLERKFGIGRVLPFVSGYGRDDENMVKYLNTFRGTKGAIMWPAGSRHPRVFSQWEL